MRTPTKSQPDKPVTYLWERHKEVARRVLVGQKPIDICKELGYTPAWMSTVMNSPVFKDYLAKLRERTEDSVVDIRGRISKGADKGIDLLLDVLDTSKVEGQNSSTALKVKVAMDLLDRDGHGKIQKIQSNVNVQVLDTQRLERIKEDRKRLLAGLPKIIDAELVP